MPHHALDQLSMRSFSGVTLLLIDRSISMSYGFGTTKLEQCKELAYRLHDELGTYGVLLFDHIVDEVLPIGAHPDLEELRKAIGPVPTRGTTALSSVIQKAMGLLGSSSEPHRILLLSDGRLNISLKGDVNECGMHLQAEALDEAHNVTENGIRIDCVALGEDSFVSLMEQLSDMTGGEFYAPEASKGKPALTIEAAVHSVPEELPAGRPTWSKELDSEHLAVVSDETASIYSERRMAFLFDKASGKKMRVPLISIEHDVLRSFRERKSSAAESVRRGDAILVDSSNRRALGIKPGERILLEMP